MSIGVHSWPRFIRASLSLAVALSAACGTDSAIAPAPVDPDASAGAWKTFVLPSGDAVRPPAPPADNSATTAQEVDEILRLQSNRPAGMDTIIRNWSGNGVATEPWNDVAIETVGRYWTKLPATRLATPVRSGRAFALLHAAMYDAMVATWDAKYAYKRARPAAHDRRIIELTAAEDVPSYPSEHAAAAAAAATVLAYVFPEEDSVRLDGIARAAAETRIVAGVNYRSDVEAGLALGRAVAQRVIARARADGSELPWTGTMPTGPADWRPTPPGYVQTPFDPAAGSWRTWVIAKGDAFRPAAPPSPGSTPFEKDLEELRQMARTRTPAQIAEVNFWAADAPAAQWQGFVHDEVEKNRLSTLRAARAHALVAVAVSDAFVAAWDAKFAYCTLRPVTADSTLTTVVATPPFPSFPSGHSTISMSAATVMGELFPSAAATYTQMAHEASESRLLGGIHYRFDAAGGEALGAKVGGAVVAYGRTMGVADPGR